MSDLLKVTDLKFRHRHSMEFLLNDLQFSIMSGEAISILGNSGSGKTTLIEILAGFRKPTSGKIERNGECTIVPQNFTGYPDLTVLENLDFFQRLNGVKVNTEYLINQMALDKSQDIPAGKLSYGNQKMLQLAVALTYPFSVLLIDDSIRSLDEIQKKRFFSVLKEIKKAGKGVLLTTSQKEEVDIFDQEFFLEQGNLIYFKNESKTEFLDHGSLEVSQG